MKGILFSFLFYLRVNRWMHRRVSISKQGIVLCFHRISNHDDLMFPPLKVEVFDGIMRYVSRYFEICNTKNFVSESSSGKVKMLITFDDGYKDFMENALPILKKYNIPAIHHVIVDALNKGSIPWTEELNLIINHLFNKKETGCYSVGKLQLNISLDRNQTYKSGMRIYNSLLQQPNDLRRNAIKILKEEVNFQFNKDEMMSWDDLRICLENNVEIGSHTITHDVLSTIENDAVIVNELKGSKDLIENELGVSVDSIAFPNGQFNSNVVEHAKKAGYEYVFSTEEEYCNFRFDRGVLPRISIYHNHKHESIFKVYNLHNILKTGFER